MTLTTAQQATLKAFIENDVTLNAFPNTQDGAASIADELNKVDNPDFIVWKTFVSKTEVGSTMDGSEFSSLTTAESGRLQAFALWNNEGVNPSDEDTRFLFDDIFNGAGGNITRPALLSLWKRLALIIEKIFAVGTGTDADPATLDFEGQISRQDVEIARNS